MSTMSEDAILTPQDIRTFYRLASPNLRCGCWGSVRRRCTSLCDCLEILLPSDDDPILTFERDCRGIYHLWWHPEEQERQPLKSGGARQCLTVMANMIQAKRQNV